MESILITVFHLLFISIGIILLVIAFKKNSQKKKSLLWPSVSGKVVEHSLKKYPDSDTSLEYSAGLKIEYEINGIIYDTYHKNLFNTTETTAHLFLDNYPMGSQIDVSVNPNNSEDAVIFDLIEVENPSFVFWGFSIIIFVSLIRLIIYLKHGI